jgi:hypothetical protein
VALFVRQALGLCNSVCGCERALAMGLERASFIAKRWALDLCNSSGPVQQQGHEKVEWVSCFLSFGFLFFLDFVVGCWCQQARKPGIMQTSTPASKQVRNGDTHKHDNDDNDDINKSNITDQ